MLAYTHSSSQKRAMMSRHLRRSRDSLKFCPYWCILQDRGSHFPKLSCAMSRKPQRRMTCFSYLDILMANTATLQPYVLLQRRAYSIVDFFTMDNFMQHLHRHLGRPIVVRNSSKRTLCSGCPTRSEQPERCSPLRISTNLCHHQLFASMDLN
jgi:hypothetical protein